MPKSAPAKRKGKAHAGVKPANKKQKESDKKGSDEAVGKQIVYCLENPEGRRTVVMNQATLTSHLMTGWALCYQCKNIEEALAWTNACSETKQPSSKQTGNSSCEASAKGNENKDEEDKNVEEEEAEEDTSDEEGGEVLADEQEDEDACGSPVKTKTHAHWCNRDRLYYKTYDEVAAVKKRLNDQHLKKLGLTKATANMKVAAVIPPKSKRKSAQKKEKKALPTEVRRSTRVVATDASPNYADDNATEDSEEEEEVKSDEDEAEEEASDFEQEDQEDGKDSEEEEEDTEMAGDDDDEDDAMTAAQMGVWGEKFLELLAYKEEHGHCNASRYDANNKSLGNWVYNQRSQYRKWINREKTQATEKKITMLERIGFHWGKPRAEPQVPWNTRFEELKEHLENFGSCDALVHSDYNKCSGLGKWISWQRKLFHLMKTGKMLRKLKNEQIKLMNGIGFNWDGPYHVYQGKFVNGPTTE